MSSIPLAAVVVVLVLSPIAAVNAPRRGGAPEGPAFSSRAPESTPPTQDQGLGNQPPGNDQQVPPVIRDPAVLAILESNPTTPEQLVQSIVTLIDLKAAPAAAPYIDQLLNGQLDDQTLYDLSKRFGTDGFLKIARADELQPSGGEFAQLVMVTASQYATDPDRLTAVAADLASSDASMRAAAMAELRFGGSHSAAVLIGMLADDDRAAASGDPNDDVIDDYALRTALAALGTDALSPLCGAMSCPKDRVRIAAAHVLAQVRSTDSPKFLLSAAASNADDVRSAATTTIQRLVGANLTPQQAAQYLYAETKALYLGERVWKQNLASELRLWTWSTEEQSVTPRTLTQLQASYVTAARLSEELHQLAPESPAAKSLFINAQLQAAAALAGVDQPLPAETNALDKLRSLGPAAVNDALVEAIAEDRPLSARAALDLLGEIGDERLLHLNGPHPSSLAGACSHTDPRVRYAAVNAVLRLQPTTAFPGSSYITAALGHWASTSGKPRVLIADTSAIKAQELAGLARMQGYGADTASHSRAALELAFSSPDYQFILLDITLPNADIDLVVQQLRRDARTGSLPIGFMAPPDQKQEAETFVRRYGNSAVFFRATEEALLIEQIARLLAVADTPPLSDAERMAQATGALSWLTTLAGREKSVFDAQIHAVPAQSALFVDELAGQAVDFQAACGVPGSQTALVAMASTHSLPGDLRRRAVEGFAASVNRFGILLTSSQIVRQYDLYNATATMGEETVTIMGSILDVIETAANGQGGN